jgi:hypothetical protein
MRLTWKDSVTTVTMAVITAGYLAFLFGADLPIVNTVRGTTTMVLVLGIVGGCAFGTMTPEKRTRMDRFLTVVAGLFGVVAVTAAIIGLITAGTAALAVLFGATAAMWLTATARHAFAGGRTRSALGPRTHEVIGPDKPAHR